MKRLGELQIYAVRSVDVTHSCTTDPQHLYFHQRFWVSKNRGKMRKKGIKATRKCEYSYLPFSILWSIYQGYCLMSDTNWMY
uniref:Beta-lactamase n=1 Tax=Phaeodactylum tricornutum TaxID=2850 RepID=A0A172E6T4_PHATR|nr:beta-lactamase [Phaeodactylum tricornutum]